MATTAQLTAITPLARPYSLLGYNFFPSLVEWRVRCGAYVASQAPQCTRQALTLNYARKKNPVIAVILPLYALSTYTPLHAIAYRQ